MKRARQLELAWQDDHRGARVRLLGWMYFAGGVLCLLGAFVSTNPVRRVVPLAVIGFALVLVAAALFAAGSRAPAWLLHAVAAGYSLTVGLIAAISVTPAGVVALGPAVIVTGMYSGAFCTIWALRLHLALAVGAYVAGTAISGIPAVWISVTAAVIAAIAVATTLSRLTRQLHLRGAMDALTAVLHRATWLQVTRQELARSSSRPVSVALLDLDNFKAINDEQGHLAGDALLRSVAQTWTAALRPGEVLGRFGGDEFVLLMARTTAEQADLRLRELTLAHPASWTGGITQARHGDTVTDLLARADCALLTAKKARRPRPRTRPTGAKDRRSMRSHRRSLEPIGPVPPVLTVRTTG